MPRPIAKQPLKGHRPMRLRYPLTDTPCDAGDDRDSSHPLRAHSTKYVS
jgi:hypothetical protein